MCGIIGVIGTGEQKPSSSWAAYEVYSGLLTLQHRGQDAAGILSYDPKAQKFFHHKELGLVSEVFTQEQITRLHGDIAIGHTRYATAGSDGREDLQPLVSGFPFGVGMIHNGNILNYHSLAEELRTRYKQQLLTNNDLEILLNLWCQHLMTQNASSFVFSDAVATVEQIFNTVNGAYSVIGIVSGEGLFAFRDPHGFRPLVLGEKKKEDGSLQYCLVSETVTLNFLGYQFVRDIQPGEFIFISLNGTIQSQQVSAKNARQAHCMFEWVYFSAAESTLEGQSVYGARLKLGHLLGKKIRHLLAQNNLKPDIVVPVPDTSRPAAIALAEELQIPFREALIKNRYIHRSFILNSQKERERIVELKLSPVKSEIEGKHLLLVDDSIVRGTTAKKIIALLKKNGAREVTLASTCPPIRFPCYYGIDFPTEEELIANGKNEEEIAESIGAEKVIYLEIEDLKTAIGTPHLCLACLNKDYPTSIEEGKFFGLKRRGLL